MSIKLATKELVTQESVVTEVAPAAPVINSFTVNGTDDLALDTAGGQTVVIKGKGFKPGLTVIAAGSTIGAVTLVDSTTITFTSEAQSSGTYNLFVINQDGGTAILSPGLIYSGLPTFTTDAGSLGTYYETTEIDEVVVAEEGADTITYSVVSGSLPSGATLNTAGYITGTSPVEESSTTYTFTVEAVDEENQSSTREFSLTINVDVVTWVTPSEGTIQLDGGEEMANVTLLATSAAGYNIDSYTANTLPTGVLLSGDTVYGTPNTEQTVVTTFTATSNTTNRSATRTVTWVVSLGDTFFNQTSLVLNADENTFITDASTNAFDITPNGDVRPSAFSPYNGGWSGYFDGSGDYLSFPQNNAFVFGTGDFTAEAWIYPNTVSGSELVVLKIYGSVNTIVEMRQVNNTMQMTFRSSSGASSILTSSAGTIVANQWQHIAFVRQSGTLRAYINGVQYTTAANANTQTDTTLTNRIGSNQINTGNFNGYISNVRILKDVCVYPDGTTFTPSTTPLAAISGTSLLTCQSNRFVDNSTNNFTITKNGDTKVTTFGPFSTDYRATPESYSVAFDGTGDWLTVPAGSSWAFGTGDFTIECWFHTSAVSTRGHLVANRNSTDSWELFTYSSKVYFGNGVTDFLIQSDTLSNGTWYHIAVSRSGTSLKLFVNGVEKASATNSTNFSNTTNVLGIGALRDAGTYPLNGTISNLRIVKGTAVYTSNFVPSTAPLTAITNTSLLTCQSPTVIDNSSNGFAITTVGQAQPVTANPFDGSPKTYSVALDGTDDGIVLSNGDSIVIGTSDFTIEGWYYFNSIPAISCGLFDWRPTSTQGNYPSASLTSAGLVRYYTASGTRITSNDVISSQTWNHICIERTSNTTKMYINGVLQTQTYSDTLDYLGPSNRPGIGYFASSSLGSMDGYISNFRVVVGNVVYGDNFNVPNNPLSAVSNTALLTCQSNLFIDNSGNDLSISALADAYTTNQINPFGYNEITQTAITDTTGSGYFDGTGDWLTIANSTEINFSSATTFTVECWIYPTAYAAGTNFNEARTILSTSLTSPNGWRIDLTTTSVVWYTYTNSIAITSAISINTWTHIAVTHDGTTTKLYINGSLAGSANTTWPASSSLFYIGALNSGSYVYPYLGLISNLRIVKGTAVYTSNFTPPTSPLTAIANTSLLTLQNRIGYNNSQPIDTSGIKNVITRTGNASVGSYSPFTPNGWSGYFDGTGDYLSIGANSAFDFGTGDFAIEGWIYLTDPSNINYLDILRFSHSGGVIVVRFGNNTAYSNYFQVSVTGASASVVYSTNKNKTTLVNQWFHFAFTRSGSTCRVFINGELQNLGTGTLPTSFPVSSFSDSTNITSSGTVYIGSESTTLGFFPGYISNFRIVKGAAVYTNGFTPSTTPLTAISGTSLLTLRGPSFTDDGPNRLAITRNGDTKITPFSPFAPHTVTPDSYSVYFDGTGDELETASAIVSSTEYSIEAWVYAISDTQGYIAAQYTAGNGNRTVFLYRESSGVLYFFHPNRGSYAAGTLNLNTWYHVAITRDSGGTTRIFVDGILKATFTTAYTPEASSFSIGGNGEAGSNFNGHISNMRVLNGAIPVDYQTASTTIDAQIFTPPTSPLTAISGTSLLTCQSSTVIDNSTNEYAITVNGNSQPTRFNPFGETVTTGVEYSPASHGGSVYFDGTADYLAINNIVLGSGDFEMSWYQYVITNNYILGTGNTTGSWAILGTSFRINNLASDLITGSQILNSWQKIMVKRVNGVIYLWVDDKLQGSVSNTTNFTQGALGIGSFGQNTSYPWKGYISDLLIKIGNGTVLDLRTPNAAILDRTGRNVLETVGNARTLPESPYRLNKSVYFDGTGDYLTVPDNAALEFGSSDFCIEAWVYLTGNPGASGAPIVGKTSASYPSGYEFNLVVDSTKLVTFNWYTSTLRAFTSSTALSLGTWYHVVACRSNGDVSLYINGTREGNLTNSETIQSTSASVFIGEYGGTGRPLTGYISNLRLMKGSSPYDATQTTITVPTEPLTAIANTSLLTCQSYNFKDNSTNDFTITRNGDAKVTSFGPFTETQTSDNAMYFDGTGDYITCPDSFSQFDFGTGDFTIEMWVYVNSLAAYSFLIDTRTSTATTGVWLIDIGTNGVIGWGPASSITISSSAVSTNQWYHVAVTRSGTATKMFLNGQQTGSTHTNSASIIAGGLTVGGSGLNPGSFNFNGYIDDLRITKGVARTITVPTSTYKLK